MALNEQQRKAVEFDGKHLLVLAGAGSGKTKTIISRAAYLIQNGVDPKKILILSFTRKSAREIVERIEKELSGVDTEGLKGQTFHSWCMEIIWSNPSIFNMKDFTLIDEDDKESCFKLITGKLFKNDDSINFPLNYHDIIDCYSFAVNTCKPLSESMKEKLGQKMLNAGIDIDEYVMDAKPYFAKTIQAYIEFKQKSKMIDYDDILQVVANGLASDKSACAHVAKKWEHILVDEMQDTNPLQYKLLENFFDYCHLFCVGDDAQSIYAFRGADFTTIHSFTDIVPDSEKTKLTINYRSTQEILDLSNWLLEESPLGYGKELTAANGHGDKPKLIVTESEYQEADDITDKIKKSLREFGHKCKDNMVLSRSMFGLRQVEAQCISKKIPYTVFGGIGLMQSKHVRDVVSPLRVVANPADELAWMRFLMLWKNIGEVSASRIISNVLKENTLEDIVKAFLKEKIAKEAKDTLEAIVGLVNDPSEAIKQVMKIMEPRLKELYKEEWPSRKKDIEVLQEVAKNSAGIQAFVAEYVLDPKLETTIKKQGPDDDVVILSTIHSAKGLEANNVYVVRVNPSSFPSTRAIQQGEEAVEEERRCLYVALTRAKEHLYVYTTSKSMHTDMYINDKKMPTQYFLDNLPEKLVDTEVLEDNKVGSPYGKWKGNGLKVNKMFDFNFD